MRKIFKCTLIASLLSLSAPLFAKSVMAPKTALSCKYMDIVVEDTSTRPERFRLWNQERGHVVEHENMTVYTEEKSLFMNLDDKDLKLRNRNFEKIDFASIGIKSISLKEYRVIEEGYRSDWLVERTVAVRFAIESIEPSLVTLEQPWVICKDTTVFKK